MSDLVVTRHGLTNSSLQIKKEQFFSKNILTSFFNHDILIHVDKTSGKYLEVYPSLAEGIGLENRQAGNTARGFESLYLLHL